MISIIFIFIFLCGVLLLIWWISFSLNISNVKQKSYAQIRFLNSTNIDCNESKIPCIHDSQCRDNCFSTSTGSRHSCLNGFCGSAFDVNESNDYDLCNAEHGLFRVFVGLHQVISNTCVSLHRDVFTDHDNLRPYVCDFGVFVVDVTKQNISPHDCTCSQNYTRMLYQPSVFANILPVCIPQKLAILYDRIYNNV